MVPKVMKVFQYAVSGLWLIMFLDTVLRVDIYQAFYVPGLHNVLMIFSLMMAVIIPFLFLVRLVERDLGRQHWVSFGAWLLFLYCVYDEVVVHQAF